MRESPFDHERTVEMAHQSTTSDYDRSFESKPCERWLKQKTGAGDEER